MRATSISASELRNRARLALLLALPFLLLMLLVSPRGDFPLNDDWVYAKMVLRLVNEGHFGLSPFSNAFALTQVLYAAPLVKLFGFSFTLLRLTTLFMAWVTVCMVAFTARELGLSYRASLLAGLTVAVNPLFVNLSYTFMTDVPFCAFLTCSTYSFVKALRHPTPTTLCLGSLFAVLGFFDRQFAAIVPIAFIVAVSLSVPRGTFAVRNAAGLIAPWVVAALLLGILPESEIALEVSQAAQSGREVAVMKLMALPIGIFITGLAVLPIAFAVFVEALGRPAKETVRIIAVPIVGLLAFFALGFVGAAHLVAPGQVLRIAPTLGAGPMLFWLEPLGRAVDAGEGGIAIPFAGTLAIAAVISPAFAIAISIYAGLLKRWTRSYSVRRAQYVFLLLTAIALWLAPVVAMLGPYFDRYVLPSVLMLVPAIAAGMWWRPGRFSMGVAAFLVASYFSLSAITLQDYMAWNVARWDAVKILRAKYQAKDDEINAGYEFNGMYTSEAYLRRLRDEPDMKSGKWWTLDDRYIVSPIDLSAHSPHECIERIPYYSWLGFETRQIYVYKK